MMDADNKKLINILWADDEPVMGGLFPNEYKEYLNQIGINLLDEARNSSELETKLQQYENVVDAVITDANMPKSDQWDKSDETDFSGLVEILLHTIRSLEERGKAVRFYLYTGRKKDILINDKNISEELKKIFLDTGRWFEKGQQQLLFQKIRDDFDKLSPVQFQIRNKYREVFEAAEHLGTSVSSLIMEGFLIDYRNDKTVPFMKFNAARQVLEAINMGCKEKKITPGHMSLSCFLSFLKNKELNDARLLVDLMPFQLVKEMELFLAITNKASHDDKQVSTNLKQYIDELQKNNERTYLYPVIHYTLIDLILWYNRTVKKYENNPNIRIWEGTINKDIVAITQINGSKFFGKSCDSDKTYYGYINNDFPLVKDDIVGIIKCIENSRKHINAADYFVPDDGYSII